MQVLENVQLDFEIPYIKSPSQLEIFTFHKGQDDSLILVNIKLKSII